MAHQTTIQDAMNESTHSYKATIEGWREYRRRARLRFRQVVDGTPAHANWIEADFVATSPVLEPLAKVKDLSVDICCGNDPVSICAAQDVLFAFVDRIPETHTLRSLELATTVVLPNDPNERSMATSDVWQTVLVKQDIIHENKAIQPGDLSRMHMTAFLTDPLRKLRRLRDSNRAGRFDLKFAGRTGKVWGEILDDVKDLIRGETEVKDYEVFRRYFKETRLLAKNMVSALKDTNKLQGKAASEDTVPATPESMPSTAARQRAPEIIDLEAEEPEIIDLTCDGDTQPSLGLLQFRAITKAMAMARIQGSFDNMKLGHDRLLQMAENVLDIASPLPEDKRTMGVVQRLRQNQEYVATIFPEEVDVSYYGYNQSDARFALYRSDPQSYVPARKRRQVEA